MGVGCLVAGCGTPTQYRNYSMPAVLAPSPPVGAAPSDAVPLTYEDSVQLDGGIRMVLPDRAVAAPPFLFRDDTGTSHSLESLRGRVVWIDLWAVWCATCRAEFPTVQRLHERYERDGLTILAVCRNSSREGFEGAVRKSWLSFPVVDASDLDEFWIPYGAFPTSLVLDRAGRVRAYWQGHRSLAAVESFLRDLLAEPGPGGPAGPLGPPPATVAGKTGARAPGAPASSASVVTGELELPRRDVAPGEIFRGRLVLDLAPGWHLTADRDQDSIPVDLRLDGDAGIVALDWLRPRTQQRTLAGKSREVYSGRVEIPIWGVVGTEAPHRPIDVRLAATIQACDSSSCLVPAEILLSGKVSVADLAPDASR